MNKLYIDKPLVLISQIQRSGGTLLSQLFDHHPQIWSHPHEICIGKPKWIWPEIDLNQSNEEIFNFLQEHSVHNYHHNKFYKKESTAIWEESYEIDFDYNIYKKYFIENCDRTSYRSVLNCYFTSYFKSWRNYKNSSNFDKRFVIGFTPRLNMYEKSVNGFFSAYKDGYLIIVIRNPQNWYASAKNHNTGEYNDLPKSLDLWEKSALSVFNISKKNNGKVIVLTYEDLLSDTYRVMYSISLILGIKFDQSLLEPTFNGEKILSDSSFKAVKGIDTSGLDRTKYLSSEEKKYILKYNDLYNYLHTLRCKLINFDTIKDDFIKIQNELKSKIYVVNNNKYCISTRKFIPAVAESKIFNECDSKYVEELINIKPENTALVLIDVWEKHNNQGFNERLIKNIKERIIPLLNITRKNGYTIFHAPHGKSISKYCKPLENEIVLLPDIDENKFEAILKSKNICILIYAGYAINWCLINRKISIINMHKKGFQNILVRDCTLAFEMPETLQNEWCKIVTTNIIEHSFGSSTTLYDIERSLNDGDHLSNTTDVFSFEQITEDEDFPMKSDGQPQRFVFDLPHAESINIARLQHLEYLNLPISNKNVLEVGAGIGKLTHFFINNRCKVLSTDARMENIQEHKKRHPYRHVEQADLSIPGSHDKFGKFDIIFCYGTLYHLHNPFLALNDLSKLCNEILILETCVNSYDNGKINFVEEDHTANDQAMHGVGSRPARDWVFNTLRQLFSYVYIPTVQPSHPDFPAIWPNEKAKTNSRSVFIASRVKLFSEYLVEHIPQKQIKLDNIIKSQGKSFYAKANSFDPSGMNCPGNAPDVTQDTPTAKPIGIAPSQLPYAHWISLISAIEDRLYYRDQSAGSLESLTALARGHGFTVIVELGTLTGMSTRAWSLAEPNARIHTVDLSFKSFWKANEHFPVDTSHITFHEQNILAMDFKTLWSDCDRVLFFVDAHDLPNAPIMRHVLKNALPYLPKDSLVVVDDIWFSQDRLGPDNVQEYFDKFLLSQIDELQCFTGHFAPYHKGGSVIGFREVLPLMEFVNSRRIDLGSDPRGKHVWFPWDGERHVNQKPRQYARNERESGFIEYNPLTMKTNEPLASRILPKVAWFYQQGQLQESVKILNDLINKESSQFASFALAVCLARLGQLDDANKLAQFTRQAGQENWRVNRLANDLEQRVGRPKVRMTGRKGLTIFAVPKAFKDHEAVIQKNAIRSWARLDPKPEIILMGNDQGVREMALEVGARHIPEIERNEFGTPLLNDIFHQAERASSHSILAYLNADIILTSDFVPAITQVTKQLSEFLVVGQRLNINIRHEINFDSGTWENDIKNEGLLHPVTGVDYFIFPKGLWPAIPPFALGRTAWDLWILGRALDLNIPLIDATEVITAIHQNHDYGHLKGGKEEAWSGVEAKRNVAIVGGYQAVQRNITSANYKLTAKKLDLVCKKNSVQTMATSEKGITWESIKQKSRIMLYAGDIPDIPEYLEMTGLSLNKSDERHLRHDITNPFALPNNAVEFFQSEDVFEHIPYDKLPSVICEIFRVLKPGGLFRLSVPDYRCDILQKRVVMDANHNIIFDPEGGGTAENPGHVWFPLIEQVKELLENSPFGENGKIEYLHYYAADGTPVTKPIDYSKGLVRRTPDFDNRVQNPYRPMSMVIDIVKKS